MNTTRTLDLATHRAATGISLGLLETSTKIRLHFLRAIEAEDFDRLPGGVYSISYLRQYARAIGFDEELLLRRYREVIEPKAEPVAPQRRFSEWLQQWQPRRAVS
jgi:cytoskeletal protein RodZ